MKDRFLALTSSVGTRKVLQASGSLLSLLMWAAAIILVLLGIIPWWFGLVLAVLGQSVNGFILLAIARIILGPERYDNMAAFMKQNKGRADMRFDIGDLVYTPKLGGTGNIFYDAFSSKLSKVVSIDGSDITVEYFKGDNLKAEDRDAEPIRERKVFNCYDLKLLTKQKDRGEPAIKTNRQL